jgi:hypothetical protein
LGLCEALENQNLEFWIPPLKAVFQRVLIFELISALPWFQTHKEEQTIKRVFSKPLNAFLVHQRGRDSITAIFIFVGSDGLESRIRVHKFYIPNDFHASFKLETSFDTQGLAMEK